jgi:hypothetical protein
MKKQYAIILLAISFGLLLTWGALNVSAMQSQLLQTVVSQESSTISEGMILPPDCHIMRPDIPTSEGECRIRLDIDDRNNDQQEDNGKSRTDVMLQADRLSVPPLGNNTSLQGRGGWQVGEFQTDLMNPESYSLDIYVENTAGGPSYNGLVYIYTTGGSEVGYAQTDISGHAYLDLADGVYHIKTYSYNDNFFLYEQNISVPGSIILTAVGTPEVSLTASKRDGSPLAYSNVKIGVSNSLSWMQGVVGYTDINGTITFHVTPAVYDVGIIDYTNYYAIYQIDHNFTTPNNSIIFEMSSDPSAEIIAGHPYDGNADLVINATEANLSSFYFSGYPNGIHVVMSANIGYWVFQWTRRDDASGNHWYLRLDTNHSYSYAPGEVFTFNVGGTLVINGRTADANIGEWIDLTSSRTDSFGSLFNAVFRYTEFFEFGEFIDPEIQLTDPYGLETNLDSWNFYLSLLLSTGIYHLHINWDTGPFQGVLTSESQFEVVPFTGLAVYVEDANGQPAQYADVYAYLNDENFGGYGYTGSDGYAFLDLPPGKYTVGTYSYFDHFLLYQFNVSSPGTVTLSAVGTPEITVSAKKKDGSPLNQAEVNIGPTNSYRIYGSLGNMDADGMMTIHVTPGYYDIGVEDSYNYYALYKTDQDFTQDGTVDFDMSTQESAELIASHPNDTLSTLVLCPAVNLNCFYNQDIPEGAHIVVSSNLAYYPYQIIMKPGTEGNQWYYEFQMDKYGAIYFAPGEILTFAVGGELIATGRTEDARVGEYTTLAEVTDDFGSYLSWIYTYTSEYEYYPVYPYVQLSDPNGVVYNINDLWFYIPTTATMGMYDLYFEWDTGEPYQGLLTADSQFEVLPQQTSAIISPEGGTLYSTWDDTLYEFAAGTFTDTVIVTHTVRYGDTPPNAPLVDIGHFYDVTAVYSDTGLPAQSTQPYTITIGYEDWERWIVTEDSMGLYEWDGGEWLLEPTSLVDPLNNQLIAHPSHFSTWGILGETNRVFLSLINR